MARSEREELQTRSARERREATKRVRELEEALHEERVAKEQVCGRAARARGTCARPGARQRGKTWRERRLSRARGLLQMRLQCEAEKQTLYKGVR